MLGSAMELAAGGAWHLDCAAGAGGNGALPVGLVDQHLAQRGEEEYDLKSATVSAPQRPCSANSQ